MNEEKYFNAVNILRCKFVDLKLSYKKINELKNGIGSWEKIWRFLNKNKSEKILDPEKEWIKLKESKIKIILKDSQEYPKLLKEIPQPPFGIYLMGAPILEDKVSIAIVGTRKASLAGKEIAENFAKRLGELGVVIVSGLALGIDASAHEGALKAGGQTIAVLGNGLSKFYPAQNEQLAKKILNSGGTIISEYPFEMPSLPHQFLERNRIISGLSRGVLVVEAPKISGALSTAINALNQNREVFVVPGSINDSNYEGSNDLIRAGAELVSKPEDILDSLNISYQPDSLLEKNLSSEEEKILTFLKNVGKPISADQIIEEIELAPSKINQLLSLLVVKNIVSEDQGKYSLRI